MMRCDIYRIGARCCFAALLSLVLWGSACTRRASQDRFQDADADILKTAPDWDVLLMQHWERLPTAADSADYALLYAEAFLDHGLSFDDDSLISVAEKYYRSEGNQRLLARALLAKSINDERGGQAVSALQAAMEATSLADDDDADLQQRLAFTLGKINLGAGCYHQAQEYLHRAATLAEALDTVPDRQALSYCLLAEAYDAAGRSDSFMVYMEKIKPLLPRVSQSLIAKVHTDMGDYHLRRRNLPTAQYYLTEAVNYDLDRRASYLLANLYQKMGNGRLAEHYWYDALYASDARVRIAATDSLLLRHPNDAGLLSLLVSAYKDIPSISGADELSSWQIERRQQARDRVVYRRIIALLSVIIVLLVLLLAFFVYHRRITRMFRRRMRSVNEQYLHDMEAYGRARRDLAELRQRIADYQEDRLVPQQWSIEEDVMMADAVLAMHRVASKGRMPDDAQWLSLSRLVMDKDHAMASLLASHADLSERERQVLMLVRLRFLPGEMSALLGITPQAITNMRMRLMAKMFGEKGGAKAFDERIHKL